MMEELCEIGQDLWESFCSICDDDSYKNYVDHVKSCSDCIQKLGLTKEDIEILNEDDLESVDMGKFETITDTELVEEIKHRGIKIEIPGNDNSSNFCSSERPYCYSCGTICTPVTKIKIGDVTFDIEEDKTR
jgi:hypothetical protein